MFSFRQSGIKSIMVVIILIVTTITISSCAKKLAKVEGLDIAAKPMQQIDNMYATQTENGKMKMRMEAPRMEKFQKTDDDSYDDFPSGFKVFGYNDEELLETEIVSDKARHTTTKGNEKWAAFGNVVIRNYINGQRIETDTLYWDQEKKMIYTDCYVKLFSPEGFMQGYGLESDERARNAVLLRPFDSYGIINRDTTAVSYIDSANFIGPLYHR